MKKTIRIVELFSGIGSQAKALNNLGFNVEVAATCEWDIHAIVAYDFIHNKKTRNTTTEKLDREVLINNLSSFSLSNNGKNPMNSKTLSYYSDDILKAIYDAILRTNNLVDISSVTGKQMPSDVDVLTYSFPCQDLSNVGAFHGYNKGIDKNSGSRSSLLWEVGRILKEMKRYNKKLPKYLVMENVPSLLADRHKKNFETWIKELGRIGYVSQYFLLNAKQFGLPQNRPRLLMLSVFAGNDSIYKKHVEQYFESLSSDSIVRDFKKSRYYRDIKIDDLIRNDYTNKTLYYEALECTPNDTKSRRKIWNENPKIIDENNRITSSECIRTITTKQDRHPNSGNIYFDNNIKGKSKWRYLTPRECLLFMGFSDRDYESIVSNNIKMRNTFFLPRDKIIRLAGNSIPVKLLEGFFYQIMIFEKSRINERQNYKKTKII